MYEDSLPTSWPPAAHHINLLSQLQACFAHVAEFLLLHVQMFLGLVLGLLCRLHCSGKFADFLI